MVLEPRHAWVGPEVAVTSQYKEFSMKRLIVIVMTFCASTAWAALSDYETRYSLQPDGCVEATISDDFDAGVDALVYGYAKACPDTAKPFIGYVLPGDETYHGLTISEIRDFRHQFSRFYAIYHKAKSLCRWTIPLRDWM